MGIENDINYCKVFCYISPMKKCVLKVHTNESNLLLRDLCVLLESTLN